MNVTVVEIKHPHHHNRPYIQVRARRGHIYKLDVQWFDPLYDQLSVGDTVAAFHQTNNPYLVTTSDHI